MRSDRVDTKKKKKENQEMLAKFVLQPLL